MIEVEDVVKNAFRPTETFIKPHQTPSNINAESWKCEIMFQWSALSKLSSPRCKCVNMWQNWRIIVGSCHSDTPDCQSQEREGRGSECSIDSKPHRETINFLSSHYRFLDCRLSSTIRLDIVTWQRVWVTLVKASPQSTLPPSQRPHPPWPQKTYCNAR